MFPHSNDPSRQSPSREELKFQRDAMEGEGEYKYECSGLSCGFALRTNDAKVLEQMACPRCNSNLKMTEKPDEN